MWIVCMFVVEMKNYRMFLRGEEVCLYTVWFGTQNLKHLRWRRLDTSVSASFHLLKYWPWKSLVNEPSNHFFSLCIVRVLSLSWIFPLWQPLGNLCKMIQLHYGGKYDKPSSLFQFVHVASSQVCAAFRCILKVDLLNNRRGLMKHPTLSLFSASLANRILSSSIHGFNCWLMYHCTNEQPRFKTAAMLTLGLDFGHQVWRPG